MDQIRKSLSFESIGFQFEKERLARHLREIVLPLPPTMQTPAFGGWSVLSSNGDVTDGWAQGHLAHIRKVDQAFEFDQNEGRRQGIGLISNYRFRTSICTGYLAKVLDQVQEYGLNPRRARISVVNPGHQTDLHVDGASDTYSVRLHIPLVTNSECRFEYQDGGLHMPADGNGILVAVNRLHRAFNFGPTPRYHLIMDVVDVDGVTQFHRWDPKREKLNGWAPDFQSSKIENK